MMTKKESATKRWIRVIEGESVMPKYIVFNNNTKAVQTTGNDLQELLSTYHGKAYQIMQVVPLDTREEW